MLNTGSAMVTASATTSLLKFIIFPDIVFVSAPIFTQSALERSAAGPHVLAWRTVDDRDETHAVTVLAGFVAAVVAGPLY
ncbi:hypothetical protein PWR63_31260 [Paraburkholderia sp. A2WS-5]|uniref:hypothetical protein n=1 Tax=unclassified Paraburkholderia TaxID=2615204 RepID=UPI003B7D4563